MDKVRLDRYRTFRTLAGLVEAVELEGVGEFNAVRRGGVWYLTSAARPAPHPDEDYTPEERGCPELEPAPDVAGLVDWAVRCWHEQVANRPLVNVHRRTLDSVWRQVIRFAGEDDMVLLGPRHDDMLDASGNPLPEYAAHHKPEV